MLNFNSFSLSPYLKKKEKVGSKFCSIAMEDCKEEDKDNVSRFKSPSFSSGEMTTLLELIEKYKLFILNKSITASACQAKDAAWMKIVKEFNNRCFKHPRSADSLKLKWNNMKRDSRKMAKNLIDNDCSDIDAIHARIVTLISEANNIGPIDTLRDILDDDDNIENGQGEQKEASSKLSDFWEKNSDSEEDEIKESSSRGSRSLNFSTKECQLLLQCVRKEKKHVFSKDLTYPALELKNRAWARVADTFNKLSPQKRSAQVLRTKFRNLKQRSETFFKGVRHKDHKPLIDDEDLKQIKQEPKCESKMDDDSDPYEDNDDAASNDHKFNNNHEVVPPDPLSCVLNSDSGLGSSHLGSWNWDSTDNKDIVKLKKELLEYQMETAKLERKRIENAMQEEITARESRATETALRLRAARLEAVAAAMKLPPAHPALLYKAEEIRAQTYLEQHQT